MKNCGRFVDMAIEVKEYVVQWMIHMLGENKIASAPNESQTCNLLVGSHPLYHGGL